MNPERYPIISLTSEELARIDRAEDQPEGFVKYVPIGTLFRCKPQKGVDSIVLGHVVRFEDLFTDQWGAGTGPERDRFVNVYRAEVIK